MDHKVKPILALIAISGVFLIWFLTSSSESTKCDPGKELRREAYLRLYHKGALAKVTIKNSYLPYNIPFDSLVIDDTDNLEEIRQMLNSRVPFEWKRRQSLWELRIRLILDNGTVLRLKLEKFESEVQDKDSYRIYEDCDSSFESGGVELPNKIMTLLEENGRASR